VTVVGPGLVLLLSAAAAPAPPSLDDVAFFERDVRPVLVQRCYRCHSRAAEKVKGGLLLDSRAGVAAGGSSGAAVVVPGDPERSALVKAVRYRDADLEMPPDEKLPAAEIATLEAWVRRGAPDPRDDDGRPATTARALWSLGPLRATTAPITSAAIDAELRAKLEELRLVPTARADRRTLIRRATFDLTGLPPTPEEVRAFVADRAPGAFARLVDRLLASPRYGERWGRHWLDLVRYADTAGCSSDFPVPQAARYRDWVIAAFDRDEPYDRFLREQLAGDLLPARDDEQRYQQIVATGYLALARRFGIKQEEAWHLTIEDTIENLGRTMLGLGLGCARCHDHKFDPVSQEDYYALYGIFASTRYPFTGSERTKFQKDFVPLAPMAEVERVVRPFEAQLTRLDVQIDRMDDIVSAAGAGPEVKPVADKLEQLKRERARLVFGSRPKVTMAYAVAEGTPSEAHVQLKGDPTKPGREVPRRFLSALGGEPLSPDAARGSGRLELGRWITGAGAPLVARVMVNRIWQHHFGRGLVATPNDFGARGQPPTHPQLLDRLAAAFIASGWSVKAMHRVIMSTEAYQRARGGRPENEAVDPANALLWRWSRRRLEAEAVRDAMLAASGELELGPGPAPAFPPERSWNFSQAQPYTASYDDLGDRRRAVYLVSQRLRKRPFMELFQGADPNLTTPARLEATTPLQALFLMNSPFVHERARALADRVLRERRTDRDRIERAYELVLGRAPSPEETRETLAFLGRASWPAFSRALYASNEFMFVE
jgi:hypothetical protein